MTAIRSVDSGTGHTFSEAELQKKRFTSVNQAKDSQGNRNLTFLTFAYLKISLHDNSLPNQFSLVNKSQGLGRHNPQRYYVIQILHITLTLRSFTQARHLAVHLGKTVGKIITLK